jgi:glycosyltransferase involved in cell wall biosynthesis
VPVVTSAGSPMAEVSGTAAVLVDPLDPASIGAGLRQALADPDSHGPPGLARAAEYTWGAAAGALAEVYRAAAATGGRNDST